MDMQTVINFSAGAIITIIGWFARELWVAVKDLKDDIHSIEVDLPMSYVRKEEYSETMREIKEMFNKISDKLDEKVDKH
jgi:GTP-dependent phosphoenolpyruvate carboxykinase